MTVSADDYDTTEAEDLLIGAASRLAKHRRERIAAAEQLTEALLKLDNFAGTRVLLDHGNPRIGMKLDVQIESRAVPVTFDPGEGVFKVNGVPAGLRFNIITGCFEGDPDRFYTPEPGKPPRRRAAVAVIIDKVVGAMS